MTDTKDTPPDDTIVPMDPEPKEMTVEEKINAIVQQALPKEQFNQAMNAYNSELEKLSLRIRVIEQRTGAEMSEFVKQVIDGTIDRMKEELDLGK